MQKNNSIPYMSFEESVHVIEEELVEAITACLRSNQYILGSYVENFETAWAQYCQTEHAVAVNSGTSALHLALLALGVGPGDEVITTPFTFAASAWAIAYVGAKPVFVDIDDSYNLNPALIEQAITKKTKAIIAVHLYGQPCDIYGIQEICKKHNLFFVEDAAQAHGALYQEKKIGSFGDISIFSFYPTKNLGTCGEGGSLNTDNPVWAEKLRLLRNHGAPKRYHHETIGYNYRMEGLQGAILGVKLKYLEAWNQQRQHIAQWYEDYLSVSQKEGKIQLPKNIPGTRSVYHLYTIKAKHRQELAEYLQKQGIGHSVHYPTPLHLQPCFGYLGYKRGDLPVSEKMAQEVLSLPCYPGLLESQVAQIARAVEHTIRGC